MQCIECLGNVFVRSRHLKPDKLKHKILFETDLVERMAHLVGPRTIAHVPVLSAIYWLMWQIQPTEKLLGASKDLLAVYEKGRKLLKLNTNQITLQMQSGGAL